MRSWKRPYNFVPRGNVGRWYEIKNMSAETAEITIYDEIGMWGVTAASFIKDLDSVRAERITLRISSPGGDVFDGLAILNSLRSHPAAVDVVVDGLAASAASFIAMAGDTIAMSPQSMMMIHDASGLCMGPAEDMRAMADLLDKTTQNIASVYAQRTGKPADHWREQMAAETWYTDQEAVDAGLADSIVGTSDDTETPGALATAKAPVALEAVVDPWGEIDFGALAESLTEALKGE